MQNSIPNHYADYLRITAALSSRIALASFAAGSLLFGWYRSDPHPDGDSIFVFGFCYIVLAALFNSLVLLNLLILFFAEPEQRETIAIKILIVLANIPVALFYLHHIKL